MRLIQQRHVGEQALALKLREVVEEAELIVGELPRAAGHGDLVGRRCGAGDSLSVSRTTVRDVSRPTVRRKRRRQIGGEIAGQLCGCSPPGRMAGRADPIAVRKVARHAKIGLQGEVFPGPADFRQRARDAPGPFVPDAPNAARSRRRTRAARAATHRVRGSPGSSSAAPRPGRAESSGRRPDNTNRTGRPGPGEQSSGNCSAQGPAKASQSRSSASAAAHAALTASRSGRQPGQRNCRKSPSARSAAAENNRAG